MLRSIGRLTKIVALFLAYALVHPLASRAGRRIVVAGFALTAALVVVATRFGGCGPSLRVGTYNIRQLGAAPTDMARLTEIVRGLDVDILAVQEIQSEQRFTDLARRLSDGGGRRYRTVLSSCGGRSEMRVGFLYDEARVDLRETREYRELDPGGGGRCDEGERPGLLGVFATGAGGAPVHLLVVHFTPGADERAIAMRREQWRRAYAIIGALEQSERRAVAILGDANTAGYRDDDRGERRFVDDAARAAGMIVSTRALGCSEYWRKEEGVYAPSLLDHVIVTPETGAGQARVRGYCEELRCAEVNGRDPPEDFGNVSDHCPVVVDLRR